ncbi:MAG: exo-alpha-sialidase [Candidatus Hydrogenedentes bacterium]|nr:exo-alpha-sialidase [Candidatus Hydrogenedentota bacterium]
MRKMFVVMMLGAAWAGAAPLHEEEFVFDPAGGAHGHVHASCIVETPGGQLMAVWYENGPALPEGYYAKDRDKSDNVRIGGARKPAGAATWDTPFAMADTFGVSDNNPCMVIDKQQRLWLIYPTLMGVPDWSWGSGLVRYHVASDYEKPGAPVWTLSNILVPHVQGFEAVLDNTQASWEKQLAELGQTELAARAKGFIVELRSRLKEPLARRLGWMPRAHPLVKRDGTVVLPLSNENFDVAVMAMSSDGGATWTYSNPVPEAGLTQPTPVEFDDGQILAFFRNGGPEHRIKRSESSDGGMTWGPVTNTDLLHPGAGIEALALKNGHLLMIYNDVEESPRDQLAVSISEDRGKTWKWTKHLEKIEGGRFDYPSIIQSADGTLHATYSYNLETIKHVHFSEEWVQGS